MYTIAEKVYYTQCRREEVAEAVLYRYFTHACGGGEELAEPLAAAKVGAPARALGRVVGTFETTHLSAFQLEGAGPTTPLGRRRRRRRQQTRRQIVRILLRSYTPVRVCISLPHLLARRL